MPQPMKDVALWWLILAHIIVGCGVAVAVLLGFVDKLVTNHKRAKLRKGRNGWRS